MKYIVVSATLVAGLAIGSDVSAQTAFKASGRWCGSSPEFVLSGVPAATVKLNAQMVDLNVPGFPHGGGEVAYQKGGRIECGAISQGSGGRYQGPSPPPGQVHTYQWAISALDTSGKTIGKAVTSLKVPQ
jgi:hypothetical protein